MKVTITRSFSKKVQMRQYEPVDSFCSAQMELELGDGVGITVDDKKHMDTASAFLDGFCRAEVEVTLAILRPALKPVTGKSRAEKKDEGMFEAEHDMGNTE